MKVMTVLGTRPEIIRLSRLIPKLDALCDHVLVHTGQNFDPALSDVFFSDLGVRAPDISLGVRAESFGEQVGQILAGIERAIGDEKPDRLLILGDTNSGLSAVVAKRLHRHFIGIERHPAYVEAALGRIRSTKPASQDGLSGAVSKREAPRVPFGSLVERGLLVAGTRLFDRMRRVSAVVTADGTIVSGAQRGSIHKVGAAVQNAPACNGWTFWHFERDGRLVPVDALREQVAPEVPDRSP